MIADGDKKSIGSIGKPPLIIFLETQRMNRKYFYGF
jgi:hypothetical protein